MLHTGGVGIHAYDAAAAVDAGHGNRRMALRHVEHRDVSAGVGKAVPGIGIIHKAAGHGVSVVDVTAGHTRGVRGLDGGETGALADINGAVAPL